jgi:nitrite reductase/ring-hydroxylating ferredoxin subunit
MSGVRLVALADLPDPGGLVRDVDEGGVRRSLLIVRRGAAVAVFENRCPHAGWPLERADGRVLAAPGGFLLCAGHGAQFDPLTGACVAGPGAGRGLTRVPAALHDGAVWLDVSLQNRN